MLSRRMSLLAILVTAVLLASAVMPITAYAQDPVPPVPDGATAEEAPTTEDAVTEEIPVTELPPAEEIELPEVLAEVPAGTDVVLLDESGAPLPLATNEAAEVLESGDPMWCPGTSEPGSGCTPGYESFADLLADLADDSETGAGTIYVAHDYSVLDDGGADAAGIQIIFGDYSLTDLVIQGGWDFGTNAIVGSSNIATLLNIQNWGNPGTTLTINNLDFTNGGGIDIDHSFFESTDADVILNDVSVTGSSAQGAYIETTGSITVNDSTFSASSWDGLNVFAGGDANLNGVTASGNLAGNGVYGAADGDFNVEGSDFSGNGGFGMNVGAIGDLAIENVTANDNAAMGILAGAEGDSALTNVTASGNGLAGLVVGAMGNTTLVQISADDDGLLGAAAGAIGNVSVSGASASGNEYLGVGAIALGDASLSQVTASNTYGVGAAALALGNASLSDVTANDNGVGAVAVSLGGLPLLDIIDMIYGLITGGSLDGLGLPAEIETLLQTAAETPANATVSGVSANGNEYAGVVAAAMGLTSMTDVSANSNGFVGGLAIAGGDVFVGSSAFNENGYVGLGAVSLLDGNVQLYYVTANGNGGMGTAVGSMSTQIFPYPSIESSATGSVNVVCSIITGNANEGIAAGSNTVISGNDLSGNGGGEFQTYFDGSVSNGALVVCGTDESVISDYVALRKAQLLAGPSGDCADILLSEGGVTAVFHELCGHDVAIEPPELPGDLPAGATPGASVTVLGDLPQPDGYATLSFPIPSGADPAGLGILFWDGANWEEVTGGSEVDTKFAVNVKEPGIYVLVIR